MITKVPDPLLCITVSTTLRHKPLAMTAPRKALAALIDASGGLKSAADVTSPVKSNGFAQDDHASDSDESEILSGLQEINLLDGLAKGKLLYLSLHLAQDATLCMTVLFLWAALGV